MKQQIKQQIKMAEKTVALIEARIKENQTLNHLLHAERNECVESGKLFRRQKDLRHTCQDATTLAAELETAKRNLSNLMASCF
jgi:hypothetical protein